MPIQEQNIVFVESQVMDDVPEGGGASTGRVIVDGEMNNVFEDISDLDRALGRFNLRKIFVAVQTLDTDLFGGAKSVITQLPIDDAIAYTLFQTPDALDTRASAANRVEAYLYKGPTWPGVLYENHIVGMRAISLIQRENTPLPSIGKTLCIVQDEDIAGEKEQYVRVTSVNVSLQTFSDSAWNNSTAEFPRWVVTLGLSDALRYDFAGHVPRYFDNAYSYVGKARVRDTNVADATRYFGAQRVIEDADLGTRTVRVPSIFTQLVPSAQTETPLVNRPLAPTLTISVSAGARTVDIAQQAHTKGLAVTAENRRLNWIQTLSPPPAPGALSVAFVAQGNWYELTDNGSGGLVASDPSIGAGTVNYTTGSAAVTLGALPDAGSQIIYTWASPVHYVSLVPEAPDTPDVSLASPTITAPIEPGTLTLTWQSGGIGKTATDNGAGLITGDATGAVDYSRPAINIIPAAPIDSGTNINVEYDEAEIDEGPVSGNIYTAPGPIAAGSAYAYVSFALPDGTVAQGYLHDDGSGNLKLSLTSSAPRRIGPNPYGTEAGEYYIASGTTVLGTINYAAGTATINSTAAVSRYRWHSTETGDPPGPGGATGYWATVAAGTATLTLAIAGSLSGAVSPTPISVAAPFGSTTATPITIRVAPSIPITLVPNSLRFTFGGKTYDDRSGTLYTDIDPVTGSGIVAGSVNYKTRLVEITFFAPGATGTPVITSALGVYGQATMTSAAFRTASAPIKPESLSVTATTRPNSGSSALITGEADADGDIIGTTMRGSINHEFGTVFVEFGVPSGPDWLPAPVEASTLRYNAVAYSYLPLPADIVGIDAVRLPPDGRVPIFRPGDVAVIMHTAETAPATVANSDTINCGRSRLGWVRVIGADGESYPTGYTLDRATGIVTFTDVAGMAQPVKVRHTVADLRQITDAQITGELTLSRPLSHDFPADESLISSCLLHGDRRARVSAVWDQTTWTGVWADNIIGSEATATLDLIAHPIEVTNEGAITERWFLRWTSTVNVELIGQTRGLVFSGPFTADIAPVNPATRNPDGTGGVPYLRIPVAANGGGWSTGNVVRINTVGALAPIWMARAIQQSEEPAGEGEDGCEIYCLGNVDRP